ncbi:MAG TPA: hypothetical protein VFJ90_01430 [Candidatus Didemnitutus sp.]|nr:hypothetical protein [Candidatus Didemnitutus sp.]
MRPERPEGDSEKPEQSGGKSDPTRDGIHAEQCVDNRRENQHINDLQLMYRLFLAGWLLLLPCALVAQDEAPFAADFGYASRRVFRGIERSGDAMQASVALSQERWRGSLWANRPFDRAEPDEINLSAGYLAKISDQLSVDVGATQFWFGGVPAGATEQSFEAGAEAIWTARGGITTRMGYHHDFRLKADTVQGSFGYSMPLTKLGAFLELSVFAGWVHGSDVRPDASGPAVNDGYSYYGAEAHLPYRIGGHTTVVAGVHFADSVGQSALWSPIGAGSGSRGWVSLSVNFDF